MKRFIVFTLVLVVVLTLFTGCVDSGTVPNLPDNEIINTQPPDDSGEAATTPTPDKQEEPTPPTPGVTDEPPVPDEPTPPVTGEPDPEITPPEEPDDPEPEQPDAGTGIYSKPVTDTAVKSGAESTIRRLYANLAAGMSWGDVWDRYVYSGSKTLGYTRDSFIAEKESFQQSYGITYKGITVTSSEETKPGVFLVNGLLKYEMNGVEIEENGADYVVFENGEYYISLSGSLLEAAFTRCISTFPNISCVDATVCEYADGVTIECTLHNMSDIDYYIGAATGLPVTAWQNGIAYQTDCAPGIIPAGEYYVLSVTLGGYAGFPNKLTLEKIIQITEQSPGGERFTMDILLYY